MGLNGFTEWLFSALLSWMQIIYNWFWSMLASGGQNEFMPWFSDNWLKLVIILLAVGLVVDYTIYLMRWRPYHVWLTTLRRARGYVSKPFAKEQPRRQYAGYKRVLEGLDDEDSAGDTRAMPNSRARDRVEVYEGETLSASRDAYRAPASPANVRPPRDALREDGYMANEYASQDGYEMNDYAAQNGYTAHEYASQDGYASNEYASQDDYTAHEYASQDGYAANEYAAQGGYAANDYAAQNGYTAHEYASQDGYASNEYAPQDGYAANEYAPQDSYVANDYAAHDVYASSEYAPQDSYMANEYASQDAAEPYVDAEQQYVPESIAAEPSVHDAQEKLFAEPPRFARSSGAAMPVYGRVYQGPGQRYMPVQVDKRPQFELPDMDIAALENEEHSPAPVAADEHAVSAPVAGEHAAPMAMDMNQRVEPVPMETREHAAPMQMPSDAHAYNGDVPQAHERAGSSYDADEMHYADQPEAAAQVVDAVNPAQEAKAQPHSASDKAEAVSDAAPAKGAHTGSAAQAARPAAPRRDMPRGYQSRRERAAQRREAEQAAQERAAQEQAAQERAAQERAAQERAAQERAAQEHTAHQPSISVHAMDEQTQWQRPGARPMPPRSINVRASGDTRDREYDD